MASPLVARVLPGTELDFRSLGCDEGRREVHSHSIKQRRVVLPDLHAGGAAADLARLRAPSRHPHPPAISAAVPWRWGVSPEEGRGGCSELKRPVKRSPPDNLRSFPEQRRLAIRPSGKD